MGNLWILGEPMPTGATIGVANRRLWRLQQHRLRLLSALAYGHNTPGRRHRLRASIAELDELIALARRAPAARQVQVH
jgi:hypothetical protein